MIHDPDAKYDADRQAGRFEGWPSQIACDEFNARRARELEEAASDPGVLRCNAAIRKMNLNMREEV